MIPHAQLVILEGWGVLALLLVGLGALFRGLCRAPVTDGDAVLSCLWLGFGGLLFALQVWHFFLPVDARALIAGALLAVVGLALQAGSISRIVFRGLLRNWHVCIVMGAVTLWLSQLALGGPRFGDVGSYHIPIVRWIIAYPIVPGLGNLFLQFGHSAQSYFLWAALLEAGPLAQASYHLANGLFVLALLARGVLGGARLLRRQPGSPVDLFYCLFLPVTVVLATGFYFTSPFPDPLIVALGGMLSGELIAFLVRASHLRNEWGLWALTLLAVAATTVKLSIAGLAGTVLLVAVSAWVFRERPGWARVLRTAVPMVVIVLCGVVPWMTRNVILSGCPLFPSALGALPVEWRMDINMIEFIQAPMLMVPITFMFRDPHWYARRLDTLGWIDREVLAPFAVAAVAIAIGLAVRLWRWRRGQTTPLSAVIILPTVVSFVFCFMTAPMPRYFGATLWLIPVQALLIGLGGAILAASRRVRWVVVAAILAAACFPFFRGEPVWRGLNDFESVSRTPLKEVQLPTGLVVHVPLVNETCWDALLPCTPHPNPGLRLRRAGDLGSGFVIDRSVPGAVS